MCGGCKMARWLAKFYPSTVFPLGLALAPIKYKFRMCSLNVLIFLVSSRQRAIISHLKGRTEFSMFKFGIIGSKTILVTVEIFTSQICVGFSMAKAAFLLQLCRWKKRDPRWSGMQPHIFSSRTHGVWKNEESQKHREHEKNLVTQCDTAYWHAFLQPISSTELF